MREFLKEILIEPFYGNDWFDYIFGGLLWVLTISLVIIMTWLPLLLIDYSFLELKEKDGVITEHYYIPKHTTTTYIYSGIHMIPVIENIDDSYEITVEIDGVTDNVSLDKNSWNKVKVGDKFCFKYTNGRIFKSLYIKSFCDYIKIIKF